VSVHVLIGNTLLNASLLLLVSGSPIQTTLVLENSIAVQVGGGGGINKDAPGHMIQTMPRHLLLGFRYTVSGTRGLVCQLFLSVPCGKRSSRRYNF
jgi:hypothetical protein